MSISTITCRYPKGKSKETERSAQIKFACSNDGTLIYESVSIVGVQQSRWSFDDLAFLENMIAYIKSIHGTNVSAMVGR